MLNYARGMQRAKRLDDEAVDGSGSGRKWRRMLWTFVIVLVLAALFYGGRVAWLSMMATEGAVPPASALPLPDGAEVLGESTSCGSGGCSVTFRVRPPAGQTPEALAEEMGATPQLAIPGHFLDPRTVWVSASPAGSVLNLNVDYWSEEWVP